MVNIRRIDSRYAIASYLPVNGYIAADYGQAAGLSFQYGEAKSLI